MKNKIYVGNLSYQTNEEGLESHCSQFGNVVSTKIITDRDTGRSKGFAFVEFETPESAESAIAELNGKDLDGRSLRVNIAQDKPRDNRGGGRGGRGGGRPY